jgi:receptor protein-tyrosine kinase
MSRIGAALVRATTGAVAPRQPEQELAAADEQTAEVVHETQSEQQVEESADHGRTEAQTTERRFQTFNDDYVDKVVVSSTASHALREQYRRVAATLHHSQEETGIKTIMVTSAVPDEGKTLTATNIALTLSESYRRRVLLIDADLRRPSLDGVFMMPKGFGLNEALTGPPNRKVPLVQISKHLSLLPAGAPDPDPMSTLTSERMRTLIKEAAAAFDWVIMDTAPIGILTDAKLMGTMVDGAILVVRAGRTPADLVTRSVNALGRNRVIGVILNRADKRSSSASSYSAYGYDSYYGRYYDSTRRNEAAKSK